MRPPDQVAPQPAVQMTGIVKRFDGVAANDRIDFTIRPGEIHALVGENGAGKSTLMNVLAGVYKPDAGEIRLFDRPVRFRSPRDAIRAGVGMVHQHFAQIPSCTVAQNMANVPIKRVMRGGNAVAEISTGPSRRNENGFSRPPVR